MHNATPSLFFLVGMLEMSVCLHVVHMFTCASRTHTLSSSCCSDSGTALCPVLFSVYHKPGRSVMGEYILTEVKTVKSRTLKKRSIVMETHKLYISNKIKKTKTNCLKCMYFLFSLRCLKHSSGGKPKAVSMERLWVSCTNYNLSHFLSLVHVVTL